MTPIRKAIEAELETKLGDGSTMRLTEISCAAMVERVTPHLAFPPSPMAVSRIMGEFGIGWQKITRDGKVYFRRPSEEGLQ